MATVKWSGLITDLRGSVGGMTFSACRGQATARAKPKGPVRNTQIQAYQRNRFVTSNALWQGLSDAQKGEWNTFALTPPETDYNASGDVILISGTQWFTRIQSRLSLVGLDPILTPPVGSRPSLPTVLDVELYPLPTPTASVLTLITEWDDTDYCVIFAGTTTLATNSTYINTSYFMRSIVASEYAGFDFTNAFITRFGNPVDGQPAQVIVVRQAANGLRSLSATFNQQFVPYD